MKTHSFMFFCCLLFLGFSLPPQNRSGTEFPEIENISKLKVKISSQDVKEITDKETLMKFSELIKKEKTGWEQPWYGIPVPKLYVDIFSEQKFAGHFGIGSGFFATHRDGDFFSKSTTKAKAISFLRMLNLDGADEELMMKFIEEGKWVEEKTAEESKGVIQH